jgi:hypothetical protein
LFNSINSFSDKKVFKQILNFKKESVNILKAKSSFLFQKFYTNN